MNLTGTEYRCIYLMLVEDNPVDVLLIEEALKGSSVQVCLDVATDGEEALDLLRDRCKNDTDGPCPDLILLDLNLPEKSGKEVLKEIKQDHSLRHIPVVILTTSDAHEDILETYELQASCFITKPMDAENFMQAILSVQGFWCGVAKLPSRMANQ
ncbi:MAG: response regulator [Desulfomonile tiedjei]|uniref:Response regulator n=1 Tax=Desulfomonile tiedjei TaxID=2358 RepID=A0A9D6YZW0_9BACT|nr:response regulator [Desulfomonile tiedjei]